MNELIITRTKAFLNEEPQTTTQAIKDQLIASADLVEPLLTARVEAQRKLAVEKNRLRHPKDKDLTDLDRSIMLADAVSSLQADYDLLVGLESSLSSRTTLLYALL